MIDNSLILYYFCIIVILQSIVGVGVLVLGTPFLLILNFSIIEALFILLPISIITSFINLIVMNFSNQNLNKSTYKEFKKFFAICIPSIFIGLIILKLFSEHLNFRLLVSVIIIFSIALIYLQDKISYKINFFRISILSLVGITHGLTNSGGTLMSLALSINKNKNYVRLNTTFFYLILASFQYLLTCMIFLKDLIIPNDLRLFAVLIIGIIIGNIINYYIESKIYRVIVNFLALASAFILISN